MLYNGEHVGSGAPPAVDVAVDPVDGTTLTAKALPDALAVLALSERGTMFDPGPVRLHGEARRRARPRRRGRLRGADRRTTSAGSRRAAARPRPTSRSRSSTARATSDLVAEVLETGRADQVHARRRRRRGDHGGRRRLVGRPAGRRRRHAGGRDRGVRAEVPRRRAVRAAVPARRRRARRRRSRPATTSTACSTIDDLVSGDDVFFAATGVTNGELLHGVRYRPGRVLTQSLSMRSRSGAVRVIDGRHHMTRSNLIRPPSARRLGFAAWPSCRPRCW